MSSARLLDVVLQHAPFSIFWKNTDLLFLGCNQRFADVAGVGSPQNIIGKSDFDLPWREEDVTLYRESDRSVLRSGKPLFDLVRTLRASDGQLKTIRTSKYPIQDSHGAVTGVMGIAEDITEHTLVREALQKSNERFQQAVRLARLGYHLLDVETDKVVYCSPEYAQMHGVTVDQFEDAADSEALTLVHAEDRAQYKAAIEAVRQGSRVEMKYRVIWPDGQIRHVHEIGEPVVEATGAVTQEFWTIRDITQEVEATERLSQAQRTEAIGQLTGGLAHDFNNLLAVIQGNLELFLNDAETVKGASSENAQLLRNAIEATERGGELTRKMLAFARKSTLRPRLLDISRTVEETRSWLTRTLPSNIAVTTNLEKMCWPALLDQTELQSAIVNVVVNARDAMPTGGALVLETRNQYVDATEAEALADDGNPGNYVVLRIADTGTGIPPEAVNRIFDPFFTTKAEGIGTGLGLSMVHGFVKQSGGFVRVRSEPGKGSSFEFFFPADRSETHVSKAPDTDTGPSVVPERKARILLVEDQPEVMKIMERTLRGAGHDVDTATRAEEALQRFDAGHVYDVLVSDIVMPGDMKGPDLAAAMREKDPDLQVIFISGYAHHLEVKNIRSGDVMLTKPFPRSVLLKAVAEKMSQKH